MVNIEMTERVVQDAMADAKEFTSGHNSDTRPTGCKPGPCLPTPTPCKPPSPCRDCSPQCRQCHLG